MAGYDMPERYVITGFGFVWYANTLDEVAQRQSMPDGGGTLYVRSGDVVAIVAALRHHCPDWCPACGVSTTWDGGGGEHIDRCPVAEFIGRRIVAAAARDTRPAERERG